MARMQNGDLLAQIPLFEGLSDGDREALGARLVERRYAAQHIVFAKGEAGSSMYVVLSGVVQIFLPGEKPEDPRVVLKEAHVGEYFGELSLFDDKPRSASVVAVTDTVLLELTRSEFGEHLARSRTAAMAILSEMAERLRETNALLTQRAAKDVVKEFEENLTWGQRLADRVAELNGSWAFILVLVGATVGWSLLNEILPHPFDEYPYQFYNLALAILVALQGPLIVMSQNRESMKDRAQAETDFRVNLKNELGIERLLSEVGGLRAELTKRLDVLERGVTKDRMRQELAPKVPGGPLGSPTVQAPAVPTVAAGPGEAGKLVG
jgi:CRP/FNR family cyclic AMP-dependent transcriptional regulator